MHIRKQVKNVYITQIISNCTKKCIKRNKHYINSQKVLYNFYGHLAARAATRGKAPILHKPVASSSFKVEIPTPPRSSLTT